MADPTSITLASSSVQVTGGNGPAVDIGELRSAVRLVVATTAVSGTAPGLTLSFETSADGATGWKKVLELGPILQVVTKKVTLGGLERYVRVVWAIAGAGASFTFGVTGVAHVVYASAPDVRNLGFAANMTSEATDHELTEFCIVASSESDAYLAIGKSLPLESWGDDLTLHNAGLATYRFLNSKGRQPDGPDDVVDTSFANAVKWLTAVGDGRLSPQGMTDQTPDNEESAEAVVSGGPLRGW